MLTLSLIIPVYNEERHIEACLKAIKKQTVKPLEVLVIDNNCSDQTIEIVKKFKFARVVKESQQGLIYGRNKGFNVAKGDILGRIDADSEIYADWVEKVIESFENDKKLMGITGLAVTGYLPYVRSLKSTFMTRSYFWFIHARNRVDTMWGANMAIRKSAWKQIKNDVCLSDHVVHEDQDLSVCMGVKGFKIAIDDNLRIETSGQSYRYLPKLKHYGNLFKSTRKYHRNKGSFNSIKLKKLGFWQTLPGLMLAYASGYVVIAYSILLFPIDYYFMHSGREDLFD